MKNIILTLLIFTVLMSTHTFAQEEYPLGAIIDSREMEDAEYALPADFNATPKSGSLPLEIDLRKYAPTARKQDGPTCVGYAVSNALTIMIAKKDAVNNISELDKMVFSAHYIFNQIQNRGCDGGSRITMAVELLKNQGDCYASEFDHLGKQENCTYPPMPELTKKAVNFKIKDYVTTFLEETKGDTKIAKTREQLAKGRPVIVGMNIPGSFYLAPPGTKYLNTALARPEPLGGHAMCIVGYDEIKKAMLIMNSWGTEWADEGFIWMKYDDFTKYAEYGYSLVIDDTANTTTVPSEVVTKETLDDIPTDNSIELKGTFAFRTPTGFDEDTNNPMFKNVSPVFDGNTYVISDWSMRDVYQLHATEMVPNSYVYVFSIDSENKAELHFPDTMEGVFSADVVPLFKPIVPEKEAALIIPSEFNALQSVHSGTDHICVIYSDIELEDISERINSVKQSTALDFIARLNEGFDDVLVHPSAVEYKNNEMSFSVETEKGKAVPIILNVIVD